MVDSKGEYADGEEHLGRRSGSFFEETGLAPEGNFLDLGSITQPGGKIVIAFAVEGNCNPDRLSSNLCQVEWPPRYWTLGGVSRTALLRDANSKVAYSNPTLAAQKQRAVCRSLTQITQARPSAD